MSFKMNFTMPTNDYYWTSSPPILASVLNAFIYPECKILIPAYKCIHSGPPGSGTDIYSAAPTCWRDAYIVACVNF